MPTAMSPVVQVHEEDNDGSGRPDSTAMPTTQRHAASLTEAINRANAASSAAAEAESRKEQQIKPLHERSRIEYTLVMCGGMGFSFNAGYINGACINAFAQPNGISQSVSGYTGIYTKAALETADGDWRGGRIQFCMILSFLAGATLIGAIAPRRKPWELVPEYGPAFIIGAFFLAMSTLFAELEKDDGWGVFYWAAAANGLQNAMTSLYSGNLIRTTHLTGTTTDIGLCIGQLLRGNRANAWKLRVLVLLALSFFMGALVSFWATESKGHDALIVNCCMFAVIGIVYMAYIARKYKVTVLQAATGQWDWGAALTKLSQHYGTQLDDLFNTIDTDNSGHIDATELFAALIEAGQPITMKMIQALVADVDEDHDGQITRDEFKQMMLVHLGPSPDVAHDIESMADVVRHSQLCHDVHERRSLRSFQSGSRGGTPPWGSTTSLNVHENDGQKHSPPTIRRRSHSLPHGALYRIKDVDDDNDEEDDDGNGGGEGESDVHRLLSRVSTRSSSPADPDSSHRHVRFSIAPPETEKLLALHSGGTHSHGHVASVEATEAEPSLELKQHNTQAVSIVTPISSSVIVDGQESTASDALRTTADDALKKKSVTVAESVV